MWSMRRTGIRCRRCYRGCQMGMWIRPSAPPTVSHMSMYSGAQQVSRRQCRCGTKAMSNGIPWVPEEKAFRPAPKWVSQRANSDTSGPLQGGRGAHHFRWRLRAPRLACRPTVIPPVDSSRYGSRHAWNYPTLATCTSLRRHGGVQISSTPGCSPK